MGEDIEKVTPPFDETVGEDTSSGSATDGALALTPAATAFVDIASLADTSKHLVRVTYAKPGEDEAWPKPTAIAVVPATFNTLNKWALGIGDTLATSILCEYLGDDIPIVAAPCLKAALARHPPSPRASAC